MRNTAIAFGFAFLFVSAGTLYSQETPVPPKPAAPSDTKLIQLTFPPNVEVKVLVEYVSKRLGINILYDQSQIGQRVTISSPSGIPESSLLGLLESVLKMSGLALVDGDQPGWKRIVQAKELIGVSDRFEKDPKSVTATPGTLVVTQVFQPKYATTDSLDKVIRPFLSKPGGNCFTIPGTTMLLVTDYADVLKRIAPLVEMADAPAGKVTIRSVSAKNMPATDLVNDVTNYLREKDKLLGQEGIKRKMTITANPRTNCVVILSAEGAEAEVTELLNLLDVPSDAQTKTYRFRYITPKRVDSIVRDLVGTDRAKARYESTMDAEAGLLIVTAPASVHEKVRSLQEELDVSSTDPEMSYVRFYKLKNTTATEVLATIRSLSTGKEGFGGLAMQTSVAADTKGPTFTGPNAPPPPVGSELPKPPSYKDTSKAGETPAAPAAESKSLASVAKEATLTADANTNSIIVIAPPNIQRVYKDLITMLDKRRPQVMIEVTLVTLDTTGGYSVGVEFAQAKNTSGMSRLLFSSFGLSTLDCSTGALTLNPGVGFNGIVISPDTVSAVVRALASNTRAKVISVPKVLVNDHATAKLASLAEAAFTSVNASQTVSTTSFAGYASAGTTITVTPHISEGDHLLLDYTVELSSFTGTGQGGIPPPRQSNTIDSKVTIPDGYAVVVGGLTRKDESNTVSKVPLLGDIPLAGMLFQNRNKSESRSTLFAFIRPVVLRDDTFEDLRYLSERDLRKAELPAAKHYPASAPMLLR